MGHSWNSLMGPEKEWECWCGHRFRAPGIWIPCAPVSCMAPRCPNPDYFIRGEGAVMLRQGMGGIPLPSKELVAPSTEKNVIYLGDGK